MINYSSEISANLVKGLLTLSLLAIGVYLVVQLILLCVPRSDSAVRAGILSVALLVLLLGFPVTLIKLNGNRLPAGSMLEAPKAVGPADLSLATKPGTGFSIDVGPDQPVPARKFKLHTWLAFLYLVGVLVMVSRFVLALLFHRKVTRTGQEVSDPRYIDRLRKVCAQIELKTVPRMVEFGRTTSPFVSGIIKPIVVFPAAMLCNLSVHEIDLILTHEMAHLKRRDHWMIAVQRVVESLLFFHPLVWLMSRQLSREREHACDDYVVNTGHRPDEYAKVLLALSSFDEPDSNAALAAVSKQSELRTRVSRLLDCGHGDGHPVNTRSAIMTGILLMTMVGVLCVSITPVNAQSQLDREKAIEANRAEVSKRFEADKKRYKGDFRIIEDEYQRVNQLRKSPEFKVEVEGFLKRYRKSNRAGCLFLYLARRIELPDREEYLKRAIKDFGDCFYGDGTQVAPYGMLNLAYLYDYMGETQKYNSMLDDILKKYPNATDHSQQLIRDHIESMKNPPVVAKTVPAHEADSVRPGVTELRFTFSEPMNHGGRSIVGGGDSFPEITGKMEWVDDRTLVVPVKLKPNHQYHLGLNSSKHQNFRSTKGISSVPYRVSFKTGGNDVAGSSVDSLNLLGVDLAAVIGKWGQPGSVAGPKTGLQTWEYPEPGLSIVFKEGKVVHYIAKNAKTYQTGKGLSIGSTLTEVTDKFGETTRKVMVEKWFAGNEQKVLYHHPGYDKYKINYHDHDVIFRFDKDQKVESIGVGYIYKKE